VGCFEEGNASTMLICLLANALNYVSDIKHRSLLQKSPIKETIFE